MFCSKCGALIENGQKFCSKCGNPVITLDNNQNKTINKRKKIIVLILGISILMIILFLILILKNNNYYFSNEVYGETNHKENNITTKKGKYTTSIIYDHMYEGVSIENKKAAFELIKKDSLDQKDSCPKEIIEIEKQVLSSYEELVLIIIILPQ
jgi:uncharacterized membrane protein YvbJ